MLIGIPRAQNQCSLMEKEEKEWENILERMESEAVQMSS